MPLAKKHFGQHFLSNPGVIEKIVNLLPENSSVVVEVGPGPGALTKALLKKFKCVHLVEIDPDMHVELQNRFSAEFSSGRLVLHQMGAQQYFLDSLWSHNFAKRGDIALVGNLPYNVGSEIVFSWVEHTQARQRAVFMLQKEVVQRFAAPPGSKVYGAPSVKLQNLARLTKHFNVSPGSFLPPPKVDSSVFSLDLGASDSGFFPVDDHYKKFAIFVSHLFGQRRKMIASVNKSLREHKFANLRPEQISPIDFVELFKYSLARTCP